MKAKFYCIKKGTQHQFYVYADGMEYYLFSEEYRKGVANFFSRPLTYDEVTNFSKAKRNFQIMNTMKKIPLYVRYVEKYYGLTLTNKSLKKANSEKYNKACA